MSTDVNGLARTVFKQIDLTIQEYNGLARDGELIIDLNPGPDQYKMYVGRANGTMVQTGGGGGGGNTAYADFAGVANTANIVPATGVVGIVANANFAAFAGTANVAVIANTARSVLGANVIGTVATSQVAYSVSGANVVGTVTNSVYANIANTANRTAIANVAYSVAGSNVVGPVALANVSVVVSGAAQPNITSVGTLISLQVTGNAIAGNIVSNGVMTATGNVTGGNLRTTGIVSATGNVNGANINSTGNVVADLAIVSDNYVSRTGSMALYATGTNQNIILAPTGSGVVDVSSARIANLQSPVGSSDAATKGYVDALAQGLTIKASAQCATVGDLGGTYNNGASGIGATITLGAPLATIDGYTLVNGDRILVKNQSNAAQNGVYVRTSSTVLTRATDSDSSLELQSGSFLFIVDGLVNANAGYVQTTDVTTVGTDACDFTQFSYAGSYSNGAGLDLVGTQFSVSDTTVTAGVYGSASLIPVITVNSRGQLTAASNVSVVANAANLVFDTLSSNVLYSTLTTVGTLTGLTVAGPVNLGNVANLTLTGGNAGDALLSNGSGGATWAVIPAANRLEAGTSNIVVNTSGNIVAGVAGVGGVFTITVNGIETAEADVGTVNAVDLNVSATAGVVDLVVTGLTDLGDVGNITIDGGTVGQVLTTDGLGTLTWATVSTNPAGGAGELQFNDAGAFGGTAGIVYGGGVLSIAGGANLAIGGGVAGQFLRKTGSGVEWSNPVAGGADKYFQYNNAGNLDGISYVQWINNAMSFGNIANLRIPGGLAGYALTTDGTGNLSWSTSNGTPGGTNAQLQFNNAGVFGGIPIITWSGTQLALGSNANVTISGGTVGQVLRTDGSGNLSWVSSGGGTPGGSNTQLQFNDDGVFGGITFAGFDGNVLALGSNANITISGGSAGQVLGTDGAGNLSWTAGGGTPGGINTQVQFNDDGVFGGMSTVTWDGTNISLGDITTVSIGGGNAGEYMVTDGSGVLSWVAAATANRIVNGSSNVVVLANGNVTMGVAGVSNVVQVSSTNVAIAGNVVAGGNVDGASLNAVSNVLAGVNVSAVGNVIAGNVFANTSVLATANVIAGNVQANANITANVNVAAVGNVIAGNVASNLNITAGGNVAATGNVTATGNVVGTVSVITDTIRSRTGSVAIDAIGVDQNITLNPSGVGYIDASTSKIKNVVDPVDAQDAATKNYVDAYAQGLRPKAPAQCATVADLGGTYNNGALGVGATITLGAPLLTLDGYTLSNSDRVLVKNQTAMAENGIYEYTSSTVLTRTADYDVAAEMPEGTSVFVENGTVNGTASYVQVDAVVTVGSDPINFVGFGKASEYSAGVGLTLVGTQFRLANTAVTPATYGNATHSATITVDQQGRLTAVSNTEITANAETLTGTFIANNVINSNLTTLGILTGLTVNGVSDLSANSNVKIGGGSNGQALITDGAGNLSWGTVASAGGTNTQLQYNNAGALDGIPFATYNGTVLNLGTNANIVIAGGSVGQVLSTDGIGNLSWVNTGVLVQPTIEFTAPANGTGQSFTNAGIANFAGNTKSSVYVNGVLARISDYSIVGTNVIFSRMLQTGDEISVSPIGVVGVEPATELTNGTSEVAVTLNGNILMSVAGVPNIAVMSSGGLEVGGNLSATGNLTVSGVSTLGPVGNVVITGGSNGQVLTTNGSGNLTWTTAAGAGGTPGGSNTQLQFNSAGTFGGVTTATWNGTSLSLGSNSNVKITGGNANSYLVTDGFGNLSWANANPRVALPAVSWGWGRSHIYGNDIWRAGIGNTAIFGYSLPYNPENSIEMPTDGVGPSSWLKTIQHNINFFGIGDGKFWSAGSGAIGALGNNSTTNYPILRVAASPKLTGTGITVLNFWTQNVYTDNPDSGSVTVYVHVNDNGILKTYSMGSGTNNMLGYVAASATDPFLIPQLSGKSIVDAYVTAVNAMFVTSTGEVWGIGLNSEGQLGIGNTTTPTAFTQATLTTGSPVTDASKVVGSYISATGGMFYILLTTGQVLAAGYGANGRLCNGSASGNVNRFSLVQSGVGTNLSSIVKIMPHSNGFAALDSSGNLWFAGNNVDGIWGTGVAANTAGNNYAAIKQTAISNFWLNTGTRTFNACFTLDTATVDGHRQLWASGNNIDGQLGVASSAVNTTVITKERVPLPRGEEPTDIKPLGAASSTVTALGAHLVTLSSNYYVVGDPATVTIGSVNNATYMRWFHRINDYIK